MTPDEFKAALDKLGLSPAGAARLLGVDLRTARRWSTGAKPIPQTVAAQLAAIVEAGGVTPEMQAAADIIRREEDTADAIRFLWVKVKADDSNWTVAEHDRIGDIYYLPGRVERYAANELEFGPVVLPPAD